MGDCFKICGLLRKPELYITCPQQWVEILSGVDHNFHAIAFSTFYVCTYFFNFFMRAPLEFNSNYLLSDWRVNHFFGSKQEWITFTCKGCKVINIRGRSLNMLNKFSNNGPPTYPWLTLVKKSCYKEKSAFPVPPTYLPTYLVLSTYS